MRENAASFGGDPGRVTLLGHGTGAACVEYLAHSPTTVPGQLIEQNRLHSMFNKLFSLERVPLDCLGRWGAWQVHLYNLRKKQFMKYFTTSFVPKYYTKENRSLVVIVMFRLDQA